MIAFTGIFSTLTIIRFYFRFISLDIKDVLFNRSEGPLLISTRILLGVPLFTAVFIHIFNPGYIPWSYFSLPDYLRIISIFIGIASLLLLYKSHRELGKYFSGKLVIKKGHMLVKTGPYRLIRHPMYTAYFSFFITAFFISGNWFIGLTGTIIIATLMTIRISAEEALLLKYFGQEYESYMLTTGKFLPPLSRDLPLAKKEEQRSLPYN